MTTDRLATGGHEGVYRRNFAVMVTDGILFTLAMGIIGANTVIPDFVQRLTGSEILIGLSGSLFELGWALPQLLVARWIVRFERKKWWFVGPKIPLLPVLLVLAGVVVILGPERPRALLVALFVCYGFLAIGDGLVGVPWLDLTASSLDERWRARLFGFTTAGGGLVLLAASPLIGWVLGSSGPAFPNDYALLFAVAGALLVASIVPLLFIHELPGGRAAPTLPPLRHFLPGLGRLLRDDVRFRSIVLIRLLTSLFLMASPFYVGYATGRLGVAREVAVPVQVASQTVGTVSGALLYTWLGARNNVLYLRLALAGAAVLPVAALLAAVVGPWLLYVGFLASGLAFSNLLFGYQNWIVGHAPADERPLYVGLFNTCSAAATLVAPFLAGLVVQHLGFGPLFVVATVTALSALWMAQRSLTTPVPAGVT